MSWADLMYLESEAIVRTMLALIDKGVPSMPVHDSLIVPRSAGHLTAELLKSNYQALTGSVPKLTFTP